MLDNLAEFKNLLPPIAMSFGIIPLMFKYGILVPQAQLKNFLIVLNLISIWIGYISARLISNYLFYPFLFTIGTFIIGMLLLLYITYIHIVGSKMNHRSSPFKIVTNYTIALFFITMGFTNYSANQNKITIVVNTKKPVYTFEIEYKDATSGMLKSRKLHFRNMPFYKNNIGCVIDRKQFNLSENIVIYYFDKNKHRQFETQKIEPLNIREVGLGGEYVITF